MGQAFIELLKFANGAPFLRFVLFSALIVCHCPHTLICHVLQVDNGISADFIFTHIGGQCYL